MSRTLRWASKMASGSQLNNVEGTPSVFVAIRSPLMKRIAAILVILLLAGFAVYEFAIVKVCDGSFNVTVEIDAELAKDVTRVSYMPVRQTQMDNTPDDVYIKQVKFMEHQDSVEPFKVRVGTSCRASNLGRTWGHVQQFSHVIVVLQHLDGASTAHRMAIPSGDGSRRIVFAAASAITP